MWWKYRKDFSGTWDSLDRGTEQELAEWVQRMMTIPMWLTSKTQMGSQERRLGKVGGDQAAQSYWSACQGNGRTQRVSEQGGDPTSVLLLEAHLAAMCRAGWSGRSLEAAGWITATLFHNGLWPPATNTLGCFLQTGVLIPSNTFWITVSGVEPGLVFVAILMQMAYETQFEKTGPRESSHHSSAWHLEFSATCPHHWFFFSLQLYYKS